MVPNRSKDRQHPILKMVGADNFPIGYYAGGELSPKPLAHLEENILPMDFLEANNISRYKKILRSYQHKLLTVEEQLANIINQSEIPEELIRKKNLILQEIKEIELQIEKEALQSGWQPARKPTINVVANGKDATALNADNGSRISIRRHGPRSTSENVPPERNPSISPTHDANNIIANQDGAIAANASDQSNIELDEN